MHSNSSRLRCLLRKAAARFLTNRASRLLNPVTSGGMKSFVVTRSPRGFFVADAVVGPTEDRLDGTTLPSDGAGDPAAENEEVYCIGARCGSDCGGAWGDEAGVDAGLLICGARVSSGLKSKTWCVGRHCSKDSSGDRRLLNAFRVSGIAPGIMPGGEAESGSENGS